MSKKLAIIHTTPVTIDMLKALALELMPGIEIINLMDDSILPELAMNGGDLDAVKQRWIQYTITAESLGADCVLSACSSVGDVADEAASLLGIPVLRIDEVMAEQAVEGASHSIGLAATLTTTMQPTERLLRRTMDRKGKSLTLIPMLAEEAYKLLMQGDREGHDRVLGQALTSLAERTEIVVLAQASMARVVAALPETMHARFLTSPRLGMERVKQVLEGRK
jgi:aspartate/glutamate racemase